MPLLAHAVARYQANKLRVAGAASGATGGGSKPNRRRQGPEACTSPPVHEAQRRVALVPLSPEVDVASGLVRLRGGTPPNTSHV